MSLKEAMLLKDSLGCLVNWPKGKNDFAFVWHWELRLPSLRNPTMQCGGWLGLGSVCISFPSCWGGVAKIWFASSP